MCPNVVYEQNCSEMNLQPFIWWFLFVLFKVYNLGTGNGYSVLEMVDALEKASGKKVCIGYTYFKTNMHQIN